MTEYIEYLSTVIPEKDSLKLVRQEAEKFYKTHSAEECYKMITPLYASDNFQIQEVGVFFCGYIGKEYPGAIHFLRDTVSKHDSWKVQEILAMAFDIHCKTIGYENALPLISEWFGSSIANVRRAVSEGLRVWTSRPYFKEHPDIAIRLLAEHRNDESEYVRKSIGNALRDISKTHTDLVKSEIGKWDLSSKQVKQVHKLAGAWILKQRKDVIKMEVIKRAIDIANNNKVGMFGTVDEKGNPCIKAMLYIKHDGLREFWFCSNTSSKRAKHISNNPNTCLYFYEGYEGVMLKGTAEISYDDKMRGQFWDDNMYYHYPQGPKDPDYMLIKFSATSGNFYSAKKNEDFQIK